MPRSSEPTIKAILDAGFMLFFKRGYARVSMDDIAATAGVTKRTLYYHFSSKDDLVGAVLDRQNSQSLKTFQKWSAPQASAPEAFVVSLFEQIANWSTMPGWTGSGFTRLSMELGDLPGHPARKASEKHKTAVEAWIDSELRMRGTTNPRDTAAQIAIVLEGAVTLAFIHDNADYIVRGRRIATGLVAAQNQPTPGPDEIQITIA